MNEDQTPTWRPLSDLPLIASLIDGALADTQEQYQNLLAAKDRPHVLDTALVERVEEVYTTQAEDFWLFEEQLTRWRREPLSDAQAREIARLEGRLCELGVLGATEQKTHLSLIRLFGVDPTVAP